MMLNSIDGGLHDGDIVIDWKLFSGNSLQQGCAAQLAISQLLKGLERSTCNKHHDGTPLFCHTYVMALHNHYAIVNSCKSLGLCHTLHCCMTKPTHFICPKALYGNVIVTVQQPILEGVSGWSVSVPGSTLLAASFCLTNSWQKSTRVFRDQ